MGDGRNHILVDVTIWEKHLGFQKVPGTSKALY